MSRDNLGNKQTITPHKQSVGYIRTKRQSLRKKIINKQKQIIRKRFLKQRNAASESEASEIQELHTYKTRIIKSIKLTIN